MQSTTHTTKPALRAFPKTWLWVLMWSNVAFIFADEGELNVAIDILIFTVLPPLLFIILYRYGYTYILRNDIITISNCFTGRSESFHIYDIVNLTISPIAFGSANLTLVLRNGTTQHLNNLIDIEPVTPFKKQHIATRTQKVYRRKSLHYFFTIILSSMAMCFFS